MERKKAHKLATIITAIALVLILVLYSAGRIDNLIASLLGAIVGLAALVFYVIDPGVKSQKEILEEKREREFAKIKVPRTREGTVFEVATVLILACSVVTGFATHMFESSDNNSLFDEYVPSFIGAIAALLLAYRPSFLVSIFSSGSAVNEEQLKLLIRKKRVFAIALALMALIISISPVDKRLMAIILICLGVAWIGTDFLFTFLHKKNK